MNVATIDNIGQTIRENAPVVTKLPLTGPDNMKTPHFGLFRMDTGKCLDVAVKRGYQPHTVDDLVAVSEASILAFESAHEANVTVSWSKWGHEIVIAPSREFRRSVYGTKDNLFPRVKIGGYFGGCFEVQTGVYRDACSNLMIARSVNESFVRIRHSANMRARMDELISAIRVSAGSFDKIGDLAARMDARNVEIVDFLTQLYPAPETDSQKALTQHKNRTESILRRLLRERDETGRTNPGKGQATVWEMLNAVTGYVQHDKTRHKVDGRQMTRIERAIAGANDAESESAWDLAESILAA